MKLQTGVDMCKHWKELDDDSGDFEYCRAVHRKVGCCGEKSQCDYPSKYEKYNKPKLWDRESNDVGESSY